MQLVDRIWTSLREVTNAEVLLHLDRIGNWASAQIDIAYAYARELSPREGVLVGLTIAGWWVGWLLLRRKRALTAEILSLRAEVDRLQVRIAREELWRSATQRYEDRQRSQGSPPDGTLKAQRQEPTARTICSPDARQG